MIMIEPRHEKTCTPYANNKGPDQSAHPRSLISTFVVHCLDSIISLVSISEISRQLSSVTAGRFESYLVANPENRFSRDGASLVYKFFRSCAAIMKQTGHNLKLSDRRSLVAFRDKF